MKTGATCIALVTQPTRLDGLLERWSTKGAAKFRFTAFRAHERELRRQTSDVASTSLAAADAEADFDVYETEDQNYRSVVQRLREELAFDVPVVVVERTHLPNFMFRRAVVVVVVGQDGLVANTAKYTMEVPIIGVNPNPRLHMGVLLPFAVHQARLAAETAIRGVPMCRSVTLAEVSLNDGQKMLAFNDFFIGRSGHASARYTLRVGETAEPQSSSGVIVATGAGATGWMSSVFNMAQEITRTVGGKFKRPQPLRWEDRRLRFAVREPFVSNQSSANLVFGEFDEHQEIVIESLMPENGVIFSDGIEKDFLEFNSGSIARLKVASQRANLMVPAMTSIQ